MHRPLQVHDGLVTGTLAGRERETLAVGAQCSDVAAQGPRRVPTRRSGNRWAGRFPTSAGARCRVEYTRSQTPSLDIIMLMRRRSSGLETVLETIRRRRSAIEDHTARARLERVRLEVAIVEAHGAGATQVAIAEAAGVSQPYVSQVLARRAGRFMPRTPLGERLAVHRADVEAALARFGASNAEVFGSVARGDDADGSDVDLLVDLPDDVGLFGLGELEAELADLLGVGVDVVPRRLVGDELQSSIAADLVPL